MDGCRYLLSHVFAVLKKPAGPCRGPADKRVYHTLLMDHIYFRLYPVKAFRAYGFGNCHGLSSDIDVSESYCYRRVR